MIDRKLSRQIDSRDGAEYLKQRRKQQEEEDAQRLREQRNLGRELDKEGLPDLTDPNNPLSPFSGINYEDPLQPFSIDRQ
jgi:hypothetical protein